MLSEGRKRDAAANAVLALSFAANAAQSPQALVKSGNVEAPGVANMQRLMDPRKKRKDLDLQRVSHSARNRLRTETYDDETFRQHSKERPIDDQNYTSKSKTSSFLKKMKDLNLSSEPTKKKKKTFKEFVEETKLCESSGGERGGRLLSSRGPAASKSDRNKQRQDKSNRAALSKSGFSRSPRPVTGVGARKTKWTETSTSSHHDTETGTYANQSDYAASKIGNLGPKGKKPTSKRALQAKQIRKQLGGDRTSRPVHDVAVNKKRTYDDDNSSTMTKGRSFRKEVTKGVSDNLKKAGAKSGDIVTSTPTSDSRSRMYGKTHNTKTSKRTGVTVNRISEEASLIEAKGQPTFSSREDLEKHYKGIPKGMYANNAASSENPKWRLKPKSGGAQERKARAERIASLSSPEERKAADVKKKKLQRAGLEAHHITPTHYSAKLKASMSDAEWEARKKRDAASGIYHGHHHKNIMGATTERTPESRRRRGIAHRAGGAHELEGKTKDIAHVGHKGLLAAAHKAKLRKEKEVKK